MWDGKYLQTAVLKAQPAARLNSALALVYVYERGIPGRENERCHASSLNASHSCEDAHTELSACEWPLMFSRL